MADNPERERRDLGEQADTITPPGATSRSNPDANESLLSDEDLDALFAGTGAAASATPSTPKPEPEPKPESGQQSVVQDADNQLLSPEDLDALFGRAAALGESSPQPAEDDAEKERQRVLNALEVIDVTPETPIFILPKHEELVTFVNNYHNLVDSDPPAVIKDTFDNVVTTDEGPCVMTKSGSTYRFEDVKDRLIPQQLPTNIDRFECEGVSYVEFDSIRGYRVGVSDTGEIKVIVGELPSGAPEPTESGSQNNELNPQRSHLLEFFAERGIVPGTRIRVLSDDVLFSYQDSIIDALENDELPPLAPSAETTIFTDVTVDDMGVATVITDSGNLRFSDYAFVPADIEDTASWPSGTFQVGEDVCFIIGSVAFTDRGPLNGRYTVGITRSGAIRYQTPEGWRQEQYRQFELEPAPDNPEVGMQVAWSDQNEEGGVVRGVIVAPIRYENGELIVPVRAFLPESNQLTGEAFEIKNEQIVYVGDRIANPELVTGDFPWGDRVLVFRRNLGDGSMLISTDYGFSFSRVLPENTAPILEALENHDRAASEQATRSRRPAPPAPPIQPNQRRHREKAPAEPRDPTEIPAYFRQVLLSCLAGNEDALNLFLRAENDRGRFLAALQVVLPPDDAVRFVDAENDDERQAILSEAGRDRLDWVSIERATQLLRDLTADAKEHLDPNTFDRIASAAAATHRTWQWFRQLGMTQFVNRGSKAARFLKASSLGVISGVVMRGIASTVGTLTKAGSVIPGLGAVGAVMSGAAFGSGKLREIESEWMNPPVDQDREAKIRQALARLLRDGEWREQNGIREIEVENESIEITTADNKVEIFHVNNARQKLPRCLRDVAANLRAELDQELRESDWVEHLELNELARRVAEARLYLTRREARTADGRVNNSRAEIELYAVMIAKLDKLVSDAGDQGQVAAILSVAETARQQATSGKQVGQAAVRGAITGVATYALGYYGREAFGYLNSHFIHLGGAGLAGPEHTAPANNPGQTATGAPGAPTHTQNAAPAAPQTSGNPAPSAPQHTGGGGILGNGAAPEMAGGVAAEHVLSANGGYSPEEIHSVGASWIGAHTPEAAPTQLESGLADHYVRSSIAEKLGLWKEDGNGCGHLLGHWEGHTETINGHEVYVQKLVDAKPVNGVDVSSVRIVNGQMDLSGLKIDPASELAKQIDQGPWQASWSEFRGAQIINALKDDSRLASLAGFPVDTIRANPDLATHLREQMNAVVLAQLSNSDKAGPIKLGDQIVPPVSNTMDIISPNVVGRQLHEVAQEWAQQHNLVLLEKPAVAVGAAPVAEHFASSASATSGHTAARGGYTGWGGQQTVASQPGQGGYQGWGGSKPPVVSEPVTNVPHLANEHQLGQMPSKPEPPLGQPAPEPPTETSLPHAAGESVQPSGAPVEPAALTAINQSPKPGLPVTKPGETLGGSVTVAPPLKPGEVLGPDVGVVGQPPAK